MIIRLFVTAVVISICATAAADTVDGHLKRARAFHDKGDFVHARDELRAAYDLDARPELLFALGQVELNLGEYRAAIDYYERFIATGPSDEQVALAQQAIGAARIKLGEPKPKPEPPPPPPPHREWDTEAWGLTALGGAAVVLGGGLLYQAHRTGGDRSGTLHAYEDRLEQARTLRTAGIACASGGVLVIGVALLRWRFHLVETKLDVTATSTSVGVSWGRAW